MQGELQQALPAQFKPLAGPAAGGLRNLAQQGVEQLLQRPRVQALWENANRTAQKQLLKLLEGGGGALSTAGGTVKLDLGVVLQQAAATLGVGQNLASKLPQNRVSDWAAPGSSSRSRVAARRSATWTGLETDSWPRAALGGASPRCPAGS